MAGLFANIDRKSAERAAQREVVRQQALIDAGLAVAPQTRSEQGLLTEAALGQELGGQPGPFRKDLINRETGLSKGLLDQNLQQQAATQAGLLDATGQQSGLSPSGGAQLGEPSFKDFTIESMAQFQNTGNPEDLVRFTDPQALARQNLAEDRFAMQQFLARQPSPAQMKKFVSDQTIIDGLGGLQQTAEPGFFGFGFDTIGAAAREVKRRFGGEAEQAFNAWWQEYDLFITDIRKEKFGTQFTPTEEKIFRRMTVQPSDSEQTAMTKLQRQRQILRRNSMTERSVLQDIGIDAPPLRLPPPIGPDGEPDDSAADFSF